MDARELRERAEYYRRVAMLVSDEDISKALLELAEHYAALAQTQEESSAQDD
jgi:cytochrome c553